MAHLIGGNSPSEAENLIQNEKVEVVFGCWTSASRKTVKPVFEKYKSLLFYPIQYEGLEQSPNIVYTGAAPNQQILPATKWAIDNLGKKIFIVGSDYVFPRTASAIMQDAIRDFGGEVVGDEYILLGSKKVEPMIEKIKQAKPDVIMNNINGDTNVEFFKQLAEAGLLLKIRLFSLSVWQKMNFGIWIKPIWQVIILPGIISNQSNRKQTTNLWKPTKQNMGQTELLMTQ